MILVPKKTVSYSTLMETLTTNKSGHLYVTPARVDNSTPHRWISPSNQFWHILINARLGLAGSYPAQALQVPSSTLLMLTDRTKLAAVSNSHNGGRHPLVEDN